MFETQRAELLRNLEPAHKEFYKAAIFVGPSLHFHLRALEAAQARNVAAFSEAAYAMLASWGMHRMGPGGSKMTEFADFAASIVDVWPIILRLQGTAPRDVDDARWKDLEAVFYGLRAMKSHTWLVGTTKVMAHALPRLVAPVDRNYTLMFLFGSGYIRNDMHAEWKRVRHIHQEFFYPLLSNRTFLAKAEKWVADAMQFKWDTSSLKILDNLVVGCQRIRKAPNTTPR